MKSGLYTRQQVFEMVGDGVTRGYVAYIAKLLGLKDLKYPPRPPDPPKRRTDEEIKADAAKLMVAQWERQREHEVDTCNSPIIFR